MKKRLYIIGMAVAMIFASCQEEKIVISNTNDDGAVAFSTESITPLSRVTGTSWDGDEVIGITMLSSSDNNVIDDNFEYSASISDGVTSFDPVGEIISFPVDGSAVDFVAYYPYQEEWSYEDNDMIWDISAQNGTAYAQENVDILVSNNLTNQTSGEQKLVFNHALSKVQITVSNYADTSIDNASFFEDLEGLTATLYTRSTQYNILEKKIVSSEDLKELAMVTEESGDDLIFTVIIAPGEVSDEIIFSNGDYSYSATLSLEAAASGTQYNFTATVGDKGLSILELTSDGEIAWDPQEESALSTDLEIVDNVYQIYSANGLKIFADLVNNGETSINGKLMNDINLEGSADNQWTPIGYASTQYAGTFDGGGFEVSGLYIDNSSSFYQGLFGYTKSATIKNLGVDGDVTGSQYVGGVVGSAERTPIINCYNKATVSGNMRVGGVVGNSVYTGSSVINCYNRGAVSGINNSNTNIGGIVGLAGTNSIVSSCYNSAVVSGDSDTGGVVGEVGSTVSVTLCYYDSSIFSGDGIGNGSGDVTGYLTKYMQSEEFVATLNYAVYTYNSANPNGIQACVWQVVDGGYPIFDFDSDYVGVDYFIDTDGTYLIYTATGLEKFATIVNNGSTSINGKLMNDIELSGTWTPIGTYPSDGNSTGCYAGEFDGNGYEVSGLYVSGGTSKGQGLFCAVYGGTVKNLTVSGEVISSTVNDAAGIAGYSYGATFENCHNKASVSGYRFVGGIVGYCASSTTFTDCSNAGTIYASEYNVGGIVGAMDNNTMVTNCYNTGQVSAGTKSVGGVVGLAISSTVINCYNTAQLSAGTTCYYVGGVVGYAESSSTVVNCYNSGQISGNFHNTGGVVGYAESSTVNNCYNSAAVSGNTHTGGVVGYSSSSSSTITLCYYDSNVYSGNGIGTGGGVVTGYSTTYMQSITMLYTLNNTAYTYNIDNPTATQACAWKELSGDYPTLDMDVIASSYIDASSCTMFGTGTAEDPYLIISADQLRDLSDDVSNSINYSGYYFKMSNNIDLGGEANEFTAIGSSSTSSFRGVFDGGGYEISGLYINTSADYQGLFGATSGATIKNLGVSGSVTAGGDTAINYVGGIVGYNAKSTVSSCYFKGEVVSSNCAYTGGIVGINYSYSTVTNCYNMGSVSGSRTSTFNIGGIAGFNNNSSVSNCYNMGSVYGESTTTSSSSVYIYSAGIVGYNSREVSNCYNTGSVSGKVDSPISSSAVRSGGIVGYNRGSSSSATVSDCIYDTSASGSAIGYSGTDSSSTNVSGSSTLISTMTGGSFSSTLGTDNWKEDYATQINNGYPILTWQ